MRSPSLILLLAMASTALSGCASGFDDAYVASATLVDGTGGDGLSGDEPSGEDNGGSLPAGTGDKSIVFTNGSRVVDGSARTALTINNNPDNAAEFSNATVIVDPGQPIGFVGERQLAIFEQKTSNPQVGYAGPTAAAFLQPHSVEDSEYSEFRRISKADDLDVELQYWDFTGAAGTDNYVAHFRDVINDQDAWFFGQANGESSRTTAEQIAVLAGGGPLTYQGSYVGQAKTTGWGQAAAYENKDGSWRVQGHASVELDLGSSELTGTLTPQYWEKTESDGTVVQIDVHRQPGDEYVMLSSSAQTTTPPVASPADIAAFHNAEVRLEGTISEDGAISGKATIADPGSTTGWVNGDQALSAATYGAGAEQVTGIFTAYGVKPSPTGGDTGINDDRRGTFDLQGGFGAVQGGAPIAAIPAPVP